MPQKLLKKYGLLVLFLITQQNYMISPFWIDATSLWYRPFLISVLLLESDPITTATLTKENMQSGLAYSFRSLFPNHHIREKANMQTDIVLRNWGFYIWTCRGLDWAFEIFKFTLHLHQQGLICFNQATLINPSRIVSVPNDSALKYLSPWGIFIFKPPLSTNWPP